MQDAHDLGVILRTRIPLVIFESHDEQGALELLQRVARGQSRSLYRWSVTDGLAVAGFGLQLEKAAEHAEPEELLAYLKNRARPGIYVLCDFHPWLDDGQPKIVRLIKDIALRNEHGGITLVLLSHRLSVPPELSRLSMRCAVNLPTEAEIMGLVKEEARKWTTANQGNRVKAEPRAVQLLASNLKGLSHAEVKRLARGAIVNDGAITESDIPAINRAKFSLLEMDGVLSFEYDTEPFANVAGMDNLKQWLSLRQPTMGAGTGPGGVDQPRGILLLGVQGGGKSLAARAVAGLWSLPLLRMDIGALYNKFYGETERNLRESLALADQMAPCVLWIDEIEKGLAPDGSDGGLSQRVLGTLLTWMAERKSAVFLVATANDIDRLPPELVRKGRFDELFFVDLPPAPVREQIFRIHLHRRGMDPETFDLPLLASSSEGFSGAEIEQAVVAGLYRAQADAVALNTEQLEAELMRTSPLATIMAERIAGLRHWARARNVPDA